MTPRAFLFKPSGPEGSATPLTSWPICYLLSVAYISLLSQLDGPPPPTGPFYAGGEANAARAVVAYLRRDTFSKPMMDGWTRLNARLFPLVLVDSDVVVFCKHSSLSLID